MDGRVSPGPMDLSANPRLEQIAADHVAVNETMERIGAELERLRAAVGESCELGPLTRLLGEFRGLLTDHFRREEHDEFLLGTSFPWDLATRGRVDQLLLQHRHFLSEVDQLVSEAEIARPEHVARLAGEVENLFVNLRWHDAVETGLLHRLAKHG